MTRTVKGYRLAEIECRDKRDEPRSRIIALTAESEATGFICCACGNRVPVAGDEIHAVCQQRRGLPAP